MQTSLSSGKLRQGKPISELFPFDRLPESAADSPLVDSLSFHSSPTTRVKPYQSDILDLNARLLRLKERLVLDRESKV